MNDSIGYPALRVSHTQRRAAYDNSKYEDNDNDDDDEYDDTKIVKIACERILVWQTGGR